MKVLVTGATGFVGSNTLARLIEIGWQAKPLIRQGGKGDIRDYKSVKAATKGIDVVVNCAAALSNHKLPEKDYWDINVGGVKNIVKACRENKVKKLIHISTTGIYGPTGRVIVNENSPVNLQDIYTKTKFEGDKVIKAAKDDVRSVIIRPAIAYGPGDVRPVIYALFRSVKTGFGITINEGENFLHLVYIDNLVNGIVQAIERDVPSSEDFIIADTKYYKMKRIIDEIARVQGRKYVKVRIPKPAAILVGKLLGMGRTVKFNSENRRYDIDKARKFLGYKPAVGLSEGMKRTYLWYEANDYL